MTPADYPALETALDRMAAAFTRKLSAREVLAYRDALDRLPLPAVTTAIEALTRESRWLPKASDIYQRASQATTATARLDPAARASIARGEYGCLTCLDTGFAYVRDGRLVTMDEACEHRRHVRPCPCRSTNANYAAREIAGRTSRAGRGRADRER